MPFFFNRSIYSCMTSTILFYKMHTPKNLVHGSVRTNNQCYTKNELKVNLSSWWNTTPWMIPKSSSSNFSYFLQQHIPKWDALPWWVFTIARTLLVYRPLSPLHIPSHPLIFVLLYTLVMNASSFNTCNTLIHQKMVSC